MTLDNAAIRELAIRARSRTDVWAQLLNEQDVRSVAEIGVYRGEFAAEILRKCPQIETYYTVDPWRHLDDWNKPENKSDHQFHEFLEERSGARSLRLVNGSFYEERLPRSSTKFLTRASTSLTSTLITRSTAFVLI
jgi:DNA-binding FadR family transcriptional regulator